MTTATGESKHLGNFPCPDCGSSDACGRYDDGHTHCFSCGKTTQPDASPEGGEETRSGGLIKGEVGPLEKRRIGRATCAKWGYEIGAYGGRPCQIAPYYDRKGKLCAQKLRFADKSFVWLGQPKQATLFGQQLWRDGGKRVIVTEGEIDALTVSELQGNRWPVVSIPNGADGAAAALAAQSEWLNKFDDIVLMFDNDEPGLEAANQAALLLPPGKVRIATLALKDPNELLQANRGQEVIQAMWEAKTYRPDGIVAGREVWDLICQSNFMEPVAEYPYAELNRKVMGVLPGQIHVVCGGSGTGKTEWAGSVAHAAVVAGRKVGVISLEESVPRAALRFVGMSMKQRLHKTPKPYELPEVRKIYEEIVGPRMFFYNNVGVLDLDAILGKIRYLRVASGVDLVVLDNLTVMVSACGEEQSVQLIDQLMAKLASLCSETGVSVLLCCHLKRPQGTPHEEGGQTSLAHLRGSGGIGAFSMVVVGLERNQQDPVNPNLVTMRILKNRNDGETGPAGQCIYNKDTGCFEPVGDVAPLEAQPDGTAVPAVGF